MCSTVFDANGIEDDKQVAVLLTAIGSSTYALLSSLIAPRKPREKSFAELTETLCCHFDPKPLVIAKRFHFHRRNQASGGNISEYVGLICGRAEMTGDALQILAITWSKPYEIISFVDFNTRTHGRDC